MYTIYYVECFFRRLHYVKFLDKCIYMAIIHFYFRYRLGADFVIYL